MPNPKVGGAIGIKVRSTSAGSKSPKTTKRENDYYNNYFRCEFLTCIVDSDVSTADGCTKAWLSNSVSSLSDR